MGITIFWGLQDVNIIAPTKVHFHAYIFTPGPLLRFLRLTNCRTSPDLNCGRCARTFESNETYTDLTLMSGMQPGIYSQDSTAGQEIFRWAH